MPVWGLERARELGFRGVYRIPPGGGAIELLVDRSLFTQPNGLCFDPAEQFLYVNDTEQANVRRVGSDGRLGEAEMFASELRSDAVPDRPDGMKTDESGNVWCSEIGGVWIFAPSGELLGKVRTPEVVGNLTWGGADFRTLFICASSSVYTLRTKVRAHREPYMSVDSG